MAFSTVEWINNNFSQSYLEENISTIEEAKAVANQIIADESLVRQGGSVSPVNWATEMLFRIGDTTGSLDQVIDQQGGADVTAGSTIFGWLSGGFQPSARQNYISSYAERTQELVDDIANAQSNIANTLDLPADATPEERAAAEALAAQFQSEIADQVAVAESLGLTVPESVRTTTGFQPASEVAGAGAAIPHGRLSEGVNVRDMGDGTFGIVGASSGTVYESGFATSADANARATELQSGGTADPTGAFAVTTGTGDVTGGTSSTDTVLSLLEESVASSEAAATADDPTLVVTAEMRAEWLAQAYDELSISHSEELRLAELDLGQSLTRVLEDVALTESALAVQYRNNLRSLQSDLQDRGMLFGGVRGAEEAELAETQQLEVDEANLQFQRSLEDISQAGERLLGTEGVADIQEELGTTDLVGRVIAGTPTFEAGEDQDVLTLQGDVRGTIPTTQQEEALTRAGDIETAFLSETSQFA